ncbi:MAG: hypothetical protein A2Z25_02665 [Planctomycetes bacterium RBG_16_55_9]|nr:MAG: hypothetical protein A2Z25_02665 [Planctomycetes bacterium RBG_16_55_9]
MAITLYLILILLAVAIIMGGMREPARIYQFPFGAATVFLGFIVPQLFGLLRTDYFPKWALERYIFMCILCLLMCWLGDFSAQRRGSRNIRSTKYDPTRWLAGATLLILVGGLAFLKNRSLFHDEFDMSTGITVAVNFFVTLLRYGFIMALIHLLRSRSRYALVLVLLASLFYLERIVFLGRRHDAVEFAFVLAGSVWFASHRILPRPVVIGGIVVGTLVLFSTGAYRSIAVSRSSERDWSRLSDMNLVDTFKKVTAEGGSEVIAGIYLTTAAANAPLDFGLSNWNGIVYHYVPAQVFGSTFKESLHLPVPNLLAIAKRRYGYIKSSASTVTGMVDCYASFWYLGCLKFFIIAYIMRRLYRRAIDANIIAQSLYLFMMTGALHAITHSTHWFVSPWIQMLVFWIPVMFYTFKRSATIHPVSLWKTHAASNYFPSYWSLSSRSSASD